MSEEQPEFKLIYEIVVELREARAELAKLQYNYREACDIIHEAEQERDNISSQIEDAKARLEVAEDNLLKAARG